MQGAEDEAKGSVLTYVTEAEFRKQRSRSPSCNSLRIKTPKLLYFWDLELLDRHCLARETDTHTPPTTNHTKRPIHEKWCTSGRK